MESPCKKLSGTTIREPIMTFSNLHGPTLRWLPFVMVLSICPASSRAQNPPAPPEPGPAVPTAETEAATPERPSVLRPAGPDRFARAPRTPLEYWDAADYLVRSGQAKLAAPYVDAFLKAN